MMSVSVTRITCVTNSLPPNSAFDLNTKQRFSVFIVLDFWSTTNNKSIKTDRCYLSNNKLHTSYQLASAELGLIATYNLRETTAEEKGENIKFTGLAQTLCQINADVASELLDPYITVCYKI